MDAMKKEWIEFWKKFGRMLEAGVPILATLETIRKEANQEAVKEAGRVFFEQIKEGNGIADAMERLPAYFPPSMVMVVKVGELGGFVPKALLSVAAGIEEGSFDPGSSDTAVVEAAKTDTGDVVVGTADDVPIIKLCSLILREAVRQKASDLHIESLPEGVRLRCRQDGVVGVMREMESPPRVLGPAIIGRFKIMAGMNVAEKRLPQDGRILLTIDDQPLDMRVSYVPLVEGESLVIRFLSVKNPARPAEQIFAPGHLVTVQRWLKRTQGLMVVSGPTGSGLTTALYSLLKSCDASRHKIMTIEDPVEYRLEGICQQRVRLDIGLTSSRALRATLRQAPDIIMLGEVRDHETAEIMCQAALTGHLVLTALHTNGAVQAVRRLVDIGLEPYLVSCALAGVIAQRLFRLTCTNCKEEIKPEPWMREHFPKGAMPTLFAGKGCEKCNGTGYCGRGAIHELFEPSGELIRRLGMDVSCADLQAEAVRAGLVPLRAEGLAKVAEGVTTLDEILRVTSVSE